MVSKIKFNLRAACNLVGRPFNFKKMVQLNFLDGSKFVTKTFRSLSKAVQFTRDHAETSAHDTSWHFRESYPHYIAWEERAEQFIKLNVETI